MFRLIAFLFLSISVFCAGAQDHFGGPEGKKFMKGKFKKLLISIAEKPMKEQHDILDSTIKDWMAETEQEQIDDICLMGVRV